MANFTALVLPNRSGISITLVVEKTEGLSIIHCLTKATLSSVDAESITNKEGLTRYCRFKSSSFFSIITASFHIGNRITNCES